MTQNKLRRYFRIMILWVFAVFILLPFVIPIGIIDLVCLALSAVFHCIGDILDKIRNRTKGLYWQIIDPTLSKVRQWAFKGE